MNLTLVMNQEVGAKVSGSEGSSKKMEICVG